MKKTVIFSIVLIIAGILIVIINKIIGNFNWHLRSDFIWLASFMITFGVFWLGILSLKDVKASSAYAASIAEAKLLFMVNSDYSNEYELKNGFSIYSEHGDREKEYLNTIPSVSSVSEIDRRAKANGCYFDRNLNYRDLENKDKIDHNLYKSKITQLEAKDREIKTYA